ncbi:uracil phosphoribosyltransferase [Microgenomates group bacterium RBG_16_45_19]|nr:MAG: uracil phosphoribosyltransferase [Microgenomates group bacterium RBG_16_45_19]
MTKTKPVVIVDQAMVQDSLRYLRDKETQIEVFRFHSNRICQWLFAEAVRDLPMEAVKIQTPLSQAQAKVVAGDVMIVPILRAGVAMLAGALQALPYARIGFVGLKRDENTAIAEQYYWNIPSVTNKTTIIITDPMLATGGSIWYVLDRLRGVEAASKRVVCVVAAPEGLAKVQADFPEVKIVTAAVDKRLNRQAYIVPGLGDYGDRYCGTDGNQAEMSG